MTYVGWYAILKTGYEVPYMKAKKLWKRILISCTVIVSAVVLLYGISVIYLHLADIEILDDFPARGTFKEVGAAMSAAQYGGYYDEHDRYMSEAFADQPWFGYARYDLFEQTMTIYLNEDTEEHRDAVNAYIADNDHGGCTYKIDTCTVSYGNLMTDDKRMQRLGFLLLMLGANRFYLSDGELRVELRGVLYAPAAALIHLMTEEKEALVFFFNPPQQRTNTRSA